MKPCTWLPPCCLPPGQSRLARASKQQANCGCGWARHRSSAPPASSDRRGVLQAALGPQPVEAALDLERRAHAEVALEALAVVPDLLDDGVDPLLVDPQCLAHARRHAEDALDRRVVAFQHVVDVL